MRLPITDVKTNPANPRIIKDDKFKKLVQSLKDFPEMAEAREIIINQDNIVLGGNMRLKAMTAAGWTDVPVKQVDWSQAKQDEFVIKDNASFGEWDWDALANQFDMQQLDDWGIDLPKYMTEEFGEDFSLQDGDKDPFGNMTFMLADQQIEKIKEAIQLGRSIDGDTFGNENGNGNTLYWIVEQWLAQKI